VSWKSTGRSGAAHRGQGSPRASPQARRKAAPFSSLAGGEGSAPGPAPPAGNRPCVSSRISPGSNQAAPQVRQRSTSTSPDVTPAIEGILQYGQFTETSIPVYHGPVNPLKVVVAWGAFALFHSLTVSEPYERWARGVLGDARFQAYHRLLFTLYSAAATAIVLFYVRSLPDRPLYRLDGISRYAFHAFQLCGAALLLWTPWDLKEFVGLRQWERHRKEEGETPGRNERLFTGKGYGLVRHPLYLGCSLLLGFHPEQTSNSAATAAAVVAYFYIGTFFEERRLARKYGEEYRAYQRRVPRFLPLPRRGGP